MYQCHNLAIPSWKFSIKSHAKWRNSIYVLTEIRHRQRSKTIEPLNLVVLKKKTHFLLFFFLFTGLNGATGHHPSYQMEPPPHHLRHQPARSRSMTASSIWKSLRKKYVLLCCLCGGLCMALGILYLVIYFVLGKYTSSMHYFQTMPLYIPSIVVSTYIVLFLEESDMKKNHRCPKK